MSSTTTVSPRMPKGKRRLFVVALLGGSIFVTLVILEIFLRLFAPQNDAQQWFESHQRYGFTLKKNFQQRYNYWRAGVAVDVQTNALGHRDKEYNLAQADVKRVVLIGDSFTFGEGLNAESTFDTKLEVQLAKEKSKWFVLNTGVGGWGTLQATLYANDHFEAFRPDIVVLTFCGNDPGDDVSFLNKISDSDQGRFPIPGKIFIRNHSHLYRFIFHGVKQLLYTWEMKKKQHDHPDLVFDSQSSALISADEWRLTLQRIRDFHRDFLAFNPDGVLLVQATYPTNLNTREHLQQLTNNKNLFYVDLHDAVQHLGEEKMRLPYDNHWSAEAHELSAHALFQTIRTLGVPSLQ